MQTYKWCVDDESKFQYESNFDNHSKVLTLIASAIIDKSVIANRNPLLYYIASQSISDYLRRYGSGNDVRDDFARHLRQAVEASIDLC